MQHVGVFDPELINDKQNEHTLFSFSNLFPVRTSQHFEHFSSCFLRFYTTFNRHSVPLWNLRHDEKTNSTRTTVILICVNQTSWKF
jgi:hypothetical protein